MGLVLYYALTGYHQLCCILHKMIYAPYEDADMVLSSNRPISHGMPERLIESGLFRDIVFFDDSRAYSFGRGITENTPEDRFIGALDKLAECCFSQLPYPVEEYSDLYICADHYPLGVALAHKQIPYHYFEDAAGMFSRSADLLPFFYKGNRFQYLAVTRLPTLGKNDVVVKRYVSIDMQDFDEQDEIFLDEKLDDFSVPVLLQSLPHEKLEIIFEIFGNQKLVILQKHQPSVLLLTGHYINLKKLSFGNQRLMYTLLLDYYCEGMSLYVKPHPNDVQGLYKEWFPDCNILNRALPAELTSFCVEGRFRLGITGGSSSIRNLESILEETICFSLRISEIYPVIHRYFIASQSILKVGNHSVIYTLGVESDIIRSFLNLSNGCEHNRIVPTVCDLNEPMLPENREECAVIIIDDISLLNGTTSRRDILNLLDGLHEDDIVIFINSQDDYLFYDPANTEYIECLLPVAIYKIPLKDEPLQEPEREMIFIYSKSDSLRHEILQIRIDKALSRTGLQIKVDASMNVREIFLEGMLQATEKRIFQVLQANRELEAKLKGKK